MTAEGAAHTLRFMRSDYGPNKISLRLAFGPFVDAFQLQGRSTRTEVVSFWLLGIVCNMMTVTMTGFPAEADVALGILWSLVWGWPWISLLARRLHDQNRTARWAALVFAPYLMLLLAWRLAPDGNGPVLSIGSLHRVVAWTPLTVLCVAVAASVGIATLVLYLTPGTDGTNNYGPDPRRDPESALIPSET